MSGARQYPAGRLLKLLCIAALALCPSFASAQSAESEVAAKIQALADKGNAEALYHLAMMHHLGLGVAQDKKLALAQFRKSAELGDPLGAYKLGCYYDGQGEGLIEPDAARALELKMVAAKAGYALAQQDVASLYARRDDMEQARGWLEKAAKQGWSDAMMGYSAVHNGSNGLPKDAAIVAGYFRLFLNREGGGSEAQTNWLARYEADMTAEERARSAAIVSGFRAEPTALTLKALSGMRAAERLADAAS